MAFFTTHLRFWGIGSIGVKLWFAAVVACSAPLFAQTETETEEATQEVTDKSRELLREAVTSRQLQDFDKALDLAEQAIKESPRNYRAVILAAQLYFQKGVEIAEDDRKAANEPLMRGIKLMRELSKMKSELTVQEKRMLALAVYNEACCLAVEDKTDAALDSLKEAINLGFRDFGHMRSDSDLDSIRDDPRFAKLVSSTRPSTDDDDEDDDDDRDDDEDDDDDDVMRWQS